MYINLKKVTNEKTKLKICWLMRKAQLATGRKEAVGLIHKAAKLKSKFDQYEMK